MKNLLLLFLIFFMLGCGYKPASKITKEVLGEDIFLRVIVSVEDPQNSVLIKDALTDALITRLGKRIVPEPFAQTKLIVSIGSVSFLPITFNRDGDVASYKATVILNIRTIFKDGKSTSTNTSGTYDFPIGNDSVISDSQRFDAIRSASYEALDEYIAVISVRGLGAKVKDELEGVLDEQDVKEIEQR